MIVVMAEAAYKCLLCHIIFPEHIENPISWCEMVIASQDIMVLHFAKSVSYHAITFTIYIDGMW